MTASYTYIQFINGGIGLLGTLPSGLLLSTISSQETENQSTINGSIYGQTLQSGYLNLNTIIMGQAHTESDPFTYIQLIIGGLGLTAKTPTPDLKGTLLAKDKIESDQANLSGFIQNISSGTLDLEGYIRTANSGSLDLYTTISGFIYKDLSGYIRSSIADYFNLFGTLEGIGPSTLTGELLGVSSLGLSGILEPITPIDISGTLVAIPKLDLNGILYGYDLSNISGSISGTNSLDLIGTIITTFSGYNNIIGNMRGIKGQEIPDDLYGYILPSISGEMSLSGVVLGLSIKDLYGSIQSNTIEALSGTILGEMPGGLSGSIDPNGGLLDLNGYLIPTFKNINSISGIIDGTDSMDLYGNISTIDTNLLIGEVTGTGTVGLLEATITSNRVESVSGIIYGEDRNILYGLIESIQPSSLLGIITPKVVYIDSYIPINTYNIENLMAVINSDYCDYFTQISDLSVIINGINSSDISATYVGTAGQYAITSDIISLALKNNVELADWIFFIADQPAFSENYLPIILTNSPFSELSGYIEGIRNSVDLTGSITPYYIPPVARKGVDIGEWVNTKTGERKLLKINFIGKLENFYYSSDGNKVYSENSSDYLEFVIETYQYEGSSPNSLLARKVNSHKCYINKLTDFNSIDEAIRFGILCAAGELHTDLFGYIEARGSSYDIVGLVSGIESDKVSDLNGKIIPVNTTPVLNSEIEGIGGFKTLPSSIFGLSTSFTSNIIQDTKGFQYRPTLLAHGGNEYSVVLTKTTFSGTLNVSNSPDLGSSITAIRYDSLNTTISGIL